MRAVYDTSVLATILSRREEILRIKQLISSGRVTLIASLFIINELEVVLSEKFGLTKQGAKSRARLLARVTVVVEPLKIEKVSRDPSDDPILAAADVGKAEYLVTLRPLAE